MSSNKATLTLASAMIFILATTTSFAAEKKSPDKDLIDSAIRGSRTQQTEMRKATDALDDLLTITDVIRKNYSNSTSYGTLWGAWKEITDRKLNGWHENAFGGETIVKPQGHGYEMFSVQYTNVPRDACVKFASTDLGRGNPVVFINSFKGPFSDERARELCDDGIMFTWVFY